MTYAYISVGGAAKGANLKNLNNWKTKLSILSKAAKRDGVKALAYIDDEAPQSVINAAIKKLGKSNVFIFKR